MTQAFPVPVPSLEAISQYRERQGAPGLCQSLCHVHVLAPASQLCVCVPVHLSLCHIRPNPWLRQTCNGFIGWVEWTEMPCRQSFCLANLCYTRVRCPLCPMSGSLRKQRRTGAGPFCLIPCMSKTHKGRQRPHAADATHMPRGPFAPCLVPCVSKTQKGRQRPHAHYP